MNEMQIFEKPEFGQIRTTTVDGEPWFVAVDVCRALEVGNSRQAVARLDDDEKGVISTDTLGGRQDVSIINEPGLYTLVLGSRKPEAKAFKRWITHEVLPSIRKTGAYATDSRLMEAAQLLASCRNPAAIPALVAVLSEYTGVQIEAPGPMWEGSKFDNLVHVRNWIETSNLKVEDMVSDPTTVLYHRFTSWLDLNHLGVRISSKAFCAIVRKIYGFDKKLRQGRAGKWYFQV
jgi:hypothetical protein